MSKGASRWRNYWRCQASGDWCLFSTYGPPTSYIWIDSDGTQHRIHQGGGEPRRFAVDAQLEANETLFACLDVYVVTSPERTRPVHDLLGHHLQSVVGIQFDAGKTRVWNRAGRILARTSGVQEESKSGDSCGM